MKKVSPSKTRPQKLHNLPVADFRAESFELLRASKTPEEDIRIKRTKVVPLTDGDDDILLGFQLFFVSRSYKPNWELPNWLSQKVRAFWKPEKARNYADFWLKIRGKFSSKMKLTTTPPPKTTLPRKTKSFFDAKGCKQTLNEKSQLS